MRMLAPIDVLLSLSKPEGLTNAFAFSWFNDACTVGRGYATHLWRPTAWKHQRRVQESTDAGGCLRPTKTSKQQYSAEVATATPLLRKVSRRAHFSERHQLFAKDASAASVDARSLAMPCKQLYLARSTAGRHSIRHA